MRYNVEYNEEISNCGWRDQLGLRTVEKRSWLIRYRAWLPVFGLKKILSLTSMTCICFFVQVIVGQIVSTDPYVREQIPVIVILQAELIGIYLLFRHVDGMKNIYHIKDE